MKIIEIKHLTKDYGHGRGVFDINVCVNKGECFGFLGPNGAGKSTTIRHLMGFSKPHSGETGIADMNTWKNAPLLQNQVGYLPGEIALPEGMTGNGFLKQQMKMRGTKDTSFLDRLISIFELDTNIGLKQMSLGMKRKLAVVTAFMHDPDILILDEPTSGLDPVMQEIFIDFILKEKERGKTIFMSSHIFHEVDACCDRIAIIRDGKIVSEFDPEALRAEADKIYGITFADKNNFEHFRTLDYELTSANENKFHVKMRLKQSETNKFISDVSAFDITDFREYPFSLEDYFMQFYKEEKVFEGVKRHG